LNGKQALIIREKNIEELTETIQMLSNDKGLQRELGMAGNDFVQKHFTYKEIAEELISLINEKQ
jgi:glycosyltransferase involved in cell wall biosynthesis